MLALALLSLAAAAAAPPADPVVTTGANGAYAAAVPAFDGSPVLAGDSVAFTVEDRKRNRLVSIGAASAAGARELYAAPRPRPVSAWALAGLAESCGGAAFDDAHDLVQAAGRVHPGAGHLVAGPADGRLERTCGYRSGCPIPASCRRRIAQLDDFDVSVSGARVAYVRRVRCLSAHPRGRTQVVVRNLRTGAVRVVRRGRAQNAQLAGRYLAFDDSADGRVVVVDLKTRRVLYRARAEWSSLGSDGTLATATFSGTSFRAASRGTRRTPPSPRPAEPRVRLQRRSARLRRRQDRLRAPLWLPRRRQLAVTDLDGNERLHAAFAAPERLEAFAFDGTSLAFAHMRYRPTGRRRRRLGRAVRR